MQCFFMVISAVLAIILICSLWVNGRKLKELEQEQEKELKERKARDKMSGDYHFERSCLSQENGELKRQNKELIERITGNRVRDGYCKSCSNAVEYQGRISCKLDCKCKDFNVKE